MVFFISVREEGKCEINYRKKEKKIFKRTFTLALFLFPMIKRAEKVSGFVFFRKGRGKM